MKRNLTLLMLISFAVSCKLVIDEPMGTELAIDCPKGDVIRQSLIDSALIYLNGNVTLSREIYSKVLDVYHSDTLKSGQQLNILALLVLYMDYTGPEFFHRPRTYKGKWAYYTYDGSLSIEKYIIQNYVYRFNRDVTLYYEFKENKYKMLEDVKHQSSFLSCECHLTKEILLDYEGYPSLCELEMYQLISEPEGHEKYIRLSIFYSVFHLKNKKYYELIRWHRNRNRKYFKQYINCLSVVDFNFP